MKRVEGIEALNSVGDFFFDGTNGSTEGVRFVCKIPSGEIIAIPVHLQGETPKRPVSWLWNGNTDKPTLQPSLDVQGANRWHGFVTDGQLTTC